MNVKEAMQETGKAYYNGQPSNFKYAAMDEFGNLSFYDHENKWACRVFYEIGNSVLWLTYHEVKEIRPEAAGELWKCCSDLYAIGKDEKGLFCHCLTILDISEDRDLEFMIHGKRGFERLFPHVEDESVERIEIEGVKWRYSHGIYFPIADTDIEFSELKDKGRMKMTLEIAKETP